MRRLRARGTSGDSSRPHADACQRAASGPEPAHQRPVGERGEFAEFSHAEHVQAFDDAAGKVERIERERRNERAFLDGADDRRVGDRGGDERDEFVRRERETEWKACRRPVGGERGADAPQPGGRRPLDPAHLEESRPRSGVFDQR